MFRMGLYCADFQKFQRILKLHYKLGQVSGFLIVVLVLSLWLGSPLCITPKALAATDSGAKPVVAVLDIVLDGVSFPSISVERMTNYLSSKISAGRAYLVVPRSQVVEALVRQKVKAQEPCYGDCQIELGGAVAANKVLQSKLMRIGSDCSLILDMYDVQTETMEFSVEIPGLTWDESGLKIGIIEAADRLNTPARRSKPSDSVVGGGVVEHGVLNERGEVVNNVVTEDTGLLFVDTDPPNAELNINGVSCGPAPYQDALKIGLYTITATSSSYYHHAVQDVVLTTTGARVKLVLPPAFGAVIIDSLPSDAEVLLDDVPVGRTPYQNRQVKSGDHQIELRKLFFGTVRSPVQVRDGQSLTKVLTLPVDFGGINVTTSPAGSTVLIDGVDVGQVSPIQIPQIKTGTHVVEARKDGYGNSIKAVRISAGLTETLGLELTPKLGSLVVMSTKADGAPCEGLITIDGKSVGMTPWKGPLIATKHAVSVSCDGALASELIDIQHNTQSTLRMKVEPIDIVGKCYWYKRSDLRSEDGPTTRAGIYVALTDSEVPDDLYQDEELLKETLNERMGDPKYDLFENGKAFSIITASGVSTATIREQGYQQGCGNYFHEAVLDLPLGFADVLGLALYDSQVPSDLKLLAPKMFEDSEAARRAFGKVKEYLSKKTPRKDTHGVRLLKKLRFKPEYFSYVTGRFPGQIKALVFVHVPNDEPNDWGPFARFLFVGKNGDVLREEKMGQVGQIYVLDLNRDGYDEFVLLSSGYESDSVYLLRWSEGVPKLDFLWGDGC